MAKLHSRKKGKAGTKRPKSSVAPKWTPLAKVDIEEKIIQMAKEGVPAPKIGLVMRDTYGVANLRALLGMPLVKFLTKNKVASVYPDDLAALMKTSTRLKAHLKAFKKDVHNKVKAGHIESKIQRLKKYYSIKQ